MTATNLERGAIPDAALPFRMRLALKHAGITVGEMAICLGVSRSAVSEWVNGRADIKLGMLRAFAFQTKVSLGWLCAGDTGLWQAYELARAAERFPELRADYSGESDLDGNEVCAVRDSNPEPAD